MPPENSVGLTGLLGVSMNLLILHTPFRTCVYSSWEKGLWLLGPYMGLIIWVLSAEKQV